MSDDVQIIERAITHDGYSRVERVKLRHRLFAGGWSQPITRELIERGRAVGVLPYDPARDEVVLVRQFRMGPWGAGKMPWLVETVAGIIEDGEDEETVARRETMEETGCEITQLHRVCDYYASPGIMTEFNALYCGITDTSAAGGIHGLADEGEDIETTVVPWETVWTDVQAGTVTDVKLMLIMMWMALNRESLNSRFADG